MRYVILDKNDLTKKDIVCYNISSPNNSKKQNVSTIDITRLIKIADYFNITLDWLLKDNDNNYIIDVKKDLAEDDIGIMIDNIKNRISEGNAKFYGYSMSNEVSKLANDAIDIIKKLIKQNL